jgi:Protein of unknown function (DUF2516).
MEFLVFLVGMAGLGLSVWAMIDALRASEAQWDAIGRKRLIWMIAIGASSLFFGPGGAVVALFYLFAIRPALTAAKTVES